LKSIENIIAFSKKYAVKHVVLISSTSVYADENHEVNELTTPMPDSDSGKVMLQAEELLKQQISFTTTIIRFAGLIGPGREPGRFFAGKKHIPNGNAPVNLIHLSDCIGISLAIIKQKAFGYTYNACCPDHTAKQDFYTKAATRMGLSEPEFINEKKDWKIISSLHVNNVLNYRYQINSLMSWLDTPAE
jgi:nucleoside-diphosphate-sugar epimerase